MDVPLTRSAPAQQDFNAQLIEFLYDTLGTGKKQLSGLWRQLSATYWLIVVASIVTFLTGILLLCTPIIVTWRTGQDLNLAHLSAPGFGVLDLLVLVLFKPIERMQTLMGNMGQIKLVINSFQDQVALRLLETNLADRATLGKAAEHIGRAAAEGVVKIQDYFEDQMRPRRAAPVSKTTMPDGGRTSKIPDVA
jgi:hypothetical protein